MPGNHKRERAKFRRIQAMIEANLLPPPQSADAETGILGSIMLEPADSLAKCASAGLKPEAFCDARNQILFSAIQAMDETRLDAILVSQKLDENGDLESIGGYDRLTELQDGAIVSGHIESYIKIVIEKYMAREIIRKCEETIQGAYGSESPEMLAVSHSQDIEALIPPPEETMETAIDAQLILDDKIADGKRVGVPLPWSRANLITHGIPFKSVTPLAGRDGKGKSRLATFLAEYWVCDLKIPTLYMPTEDTAGRFLKNFAATNGRYDAFKMSHNPSDEYRRTHRDCMQNIKTLPIYVHDTPSTVGEIASLIASHKKKHGIEIVVIDGWKDIVFKGSENQTAMEGETMAKLIVAAKKHDVTILLVMHLRDLEDGKWISKRDIRGNKQLTQSSRMTMIYQDSGFSDGMEEDYGLISGESAVLDICKCSYGDETYVPLTKDLERGRFVEILRDGHYGELPT